METTENMMDGSIESAAEALLQPTEIEETEAEEEQVAPAEPEAEETEVEEHEEEHEEHHEEDDDITEDTDDTEDDAASETQAFTVKIDGEEKSVSLDELKQGYSGQKFVQKL